MKAVPQPLVADVPELYGAEPVAIAAHHPRASTPRIRSALLIIGHNPGMHELALALIGSGDAAGRKALADNLPTSGLAVIDFAIEDWNDVSFRGGTARAVRQPETAARRQPANRVMTARAGEDAGFVIYWPTTEAQMFKSILVPIDLADTDLAKPAIATAATLSQTYSGTVRLLNVLPMTPVMLAEYVPADFDVQQRQSSEEALAIVAQESGIDAPRISSVVRQGGIYHEILQEAAAIKADLIVMTSHRPAMRTYFLGSNAGHVVRYATCSVLVVRH